MCKQSYQASRKLDEQLEGIRKTRTENGIRLFSKSLHVSNMLFHSNSYSRILSATPLDGISFR